MVKLLDPSNTADGGTTGRGLTRQKRRIGLDRRVNRRAAAITIIPALLLALLSSVVVGQVFSLGPAFGVVRQAHVIQQDPDAAAMASSAGDLPGFADYREDRRGDAPAASAPVAYCAAVYQRNDELYRACAASAAPSLVEDRSGQPTVPTSTGVGDIEYLPGDQITGTRSAVPTGAGGGPIEYLPGEEDASPLPWLVPDDEAAPLFGDQP